jgi:hypothetical protein
MMSMTQDVPKPNAQGERFIALARKADVDKPDETFDAKFEEIAAARSPLAKARRNASRVTRTAR